MTVGSTIKQWLLLLLAMTGISAVVLTIWHFLQQQSREAATKEGKKRSIKQNLQHKGRKITMDNIIISDVDTGAELAATTAQAATREEEPIGYIESLKGLVNAIEFKTHISYLINMSDARFAHYTDQVKQSSRFETTRDKEIATQFLTYVTSKRDEQKSSPKQDILTADIDELLYCPIILPTKRTATQKELKWVHDQLIKLNQELFWQAIPYRFISGIDEERSADDGSWEVSETPLSNGNFIELQEKKYADPLSRDDKFELRGITKEFITNPDSQQTARLKPVDIIYRRVKNINNNTTLEQALESLTMLDLSNRPEALLSILKSQRAAYHPDKHRGKSTQEQIKHEQIYNAIDKVHDAVLAINEQFARFWYSTYCCDSKDFFEFQLQDINNDVIEKHVASIGTPMSNIDQIVRSNTFIKKRDKINNIKDEMLPKFRTLVCYAEAELNQALRNKRTSHRHSPSIKTLKELNQSAYEMIEEMLQLIKGFPAIKADYSAEIAAEQQKLAKTTNAKEKFLAQRKLFELKDELARRFAAPTEAAVNAIPKLKKAYATEAGHTAAWRHTYKKLRSGIGSAFSVSIFDLGGDDLDELVEEAEEEVETTQFKETKYDCLAQYKLLDDDYRNLIKEVNSHTSSKWRSWLGTQEAPTASTLQTLTTQRETLQKRNIELQKQQTAAERSAEYAAMRCLDDSVVKKYRRKNGYVDYVDILVQQEQEKTKEAENKTKEAENKTKEAENKATAERIAKEQADREKKATTMFFLEAVKKLPPDKITADISIIHQFTFVISYQDIKAAYHKLQNKYDNLATALRDGKITHQDASIQLTTLAAERATLDEQLQQSRSEERNFNHPIYGDEDIADFAEYTTNQVSTARQSAEHSRLTLGTKADEVLTQLMTLQEERGEEVADQREIAVKFQQIKESLQDIQQGIDDVRADRGLPSTSLTRLTRQQISSDTHQQRGAWGGV